MLLSSSQRESSGCNSIFLCTAHCLSSRHSTTWSLNLKFAAYFLLKISLLIVIENYQINNTIHAKWWIYYSDIVISSNWHLINSNWFDWDGFCFDHKLILVVWELLGLCCMLIRTLIKVFKAPWWSAFVSCGSCVRSSLIMLSWAWLCEFNLDAGAAF